MNTPYPCSGGDTAAYVARYKTWMCRWATPSLDCTRGDLSKHENWCCPWRELTSWSKCVTHTGGWVNECRNYACSAMRNGTCSTRRGCEWCDQALRTEYIGQDDTCPFHYADVCPRFEQRNVNGLKALVHRIPPYAKYSCNGVPREWYKAICKAAGVEPGTGQKQKCGKGVRREGYGKRKTA